MTRQERRSWIGVGVLFIAMFVVWGGAVNSSAVFFDPLLRDFGWTRVRLSTLGAAAAIAAGLAGPIVGWLLDRVEARVVMVGGTAVTAAGFFALSRANSFRAMLLAYTVIGIGIVASTVIPSSVVISNWFGERRGLAMGIAFAGMSLGGTGMTLVVNHVVQAHGWRAGFVTIALPIVVVVIPLLAVFIRTEHQRPVRRSLADPAADAARPGLEMHEALRTRSLWLISAAQCLFNCVVTGVGAHLVIYLIGIGYHPNSAAEVLSASFLFTTLGSLAGGPLGDWVGARSTMSAMLCALAVAMVLLCGGAHVTAIAAFMPVYGAALGATSVLIPLVTLESLGLRRLGSAMGFTAIFATVGIAAGPVIAGWIYDATGSYADALWLFTVMAVFSGAAIYGCRPLAQEQLRFGSVSTDALRRDIGR